MGLLPGEPWEVARRDSRGLSHCSQMSSCSTAVWHVTTVKRLQATCVHLHFCRSQAGSSRIEVYARILPSNTVCLLAAFLEFGGSGVARELSFGSRSEVPVYCVSCQPGSCLSSSPYSPLCGHLVAFFPEVSWGFSLLVFILFDFMERVF